jgi:hypothetical protein
LGCATHRMFLLFIGAPRRVMICIGPALATLFIARLVEADGQARRPSSPDRPAGLLDADLGR